MSYTLPRLVLWEGQSHEMAFRLIPAGSFWMGSHGYDTHEEPRHRVEMSAFYMAETPVTQEQYALWKPGHKNHFHGKPDHPAEDMDWDDAIRYAEWLKPICPAGWVASLPTEAQWEYACRAGTESEYWSGDGETALDEVAWFGEGWDTGSTHPVNSLDPNPWGLRHMHGQVWEWCLDGWDEAAYQKLAHEHLDPFTPHAKNPRRVIRGGSWAFSAAFCRSAIRDADTPEGRGRNLGFRLCLVSSGSAGFQPAMSNWTGKSTLPG